eukprot:5932318-Pyramimonas_sp.AAC.1
MYVERHLCWEGLGQGMDVISQQRLLKHLGQLPRGRRLSELLLTVIAGGSWPRLHRAEASAKVQGCVLCPRCKRRNESVFHRMWECDHNVNHPIYTKSDEAYLESASQPESAPAYWLSGAMPAQWTAVPEPPDDEFWSQTGLNEGVADGALGPGECARPVLLFGDASGGADSSDGGLRSIRRISLGLAQME